MTKGADNSQFGYLCTVEIKKTSFENNKKKYTMGFNEFKASCSATKQLVT